MAPHSSSPDPVISDIKARLRRDALGRRDALDPLRRSEASRRIADRALALPDLRGPTTVGGFWPIRSEVDLVPLMMALHARGQGLALPVVQPPALIFRAWTPGDPLERRSFGLSEPSASAPEVFPEALLVPLACFDRGGGRVGYGKGYYDRAIAALSARRPVLTVGIAFAVQETERVPVAPHDRRLDWVVTEQEAIRSRP